MIVPITLAQFREDVPIDLATRAHSGTSHVPETRANQERQSYAAQLVADLEMIEGIATRNDTAHLIADQFERYRAGYRLRYLAMLSAKSRCASTMITGGSNFNTRRARKSSDSADRRTQELIEFRTRALTAIRKVLAPSEGPIASGDSDAVARLTEKLSKAEAFQARAKEANKIIRIAGVTIDTRVLLLIDEGWTHDDAYALFKPDSFGNIGIAPFTLTNNAAEIRRLKKRIAEVSAAKLEPVRAIAAKDNPSGIRLEDSPAADRVRLFFPGKPSAEVRAALKANAFRWTPTMGCWQAFRNHRTIAYAEQMTKGTPKP